MSTSKEVDNRTIIVEDYSEEFVFEVDAAYKINFVAKCFTLAPEVGPGAPISWMIYPQNKGDILTVVEKYRIRNANMLKWLHDGKIIHSYEQNLFFARNSDKIEKLT